MKEGGGCRVGVKEGAAQADSMWKVLPGLNKGGRMLLKRVEAGGGCRDIRDIRLHLSHVTSCHVFIHAEPSDNELLAG